MTTRNDKLRGLFLAALMVFSVFAGTVAFSGAAAAADVNRGSASGMWDTTGNGGVIGDGATIYQGEEQIEEYSDASGTTTALANFERTGGSDEGLPLSNPVPQDQPAGSYELVGNTEKTLTVQTPRITTFDINNENGADISGGTVPASQDTVTVAATYNFEEAEDLEVSIEDEDGNDVTDVAVDDSTANPYDDDSQGNVDGYDVAIDIDLTQLESGEEYTVTVEGTEDLNFDDASLSDTFEITSSDDPTLSLASDSVTQGENVNYDIEGATEGDYHLVTIDSSEFREDISVENARDIFRNINDVDQTGILDSDGNEIDGDASLDDVDAAYATVEIDGGVGTGSIETQYLTDSSVDVELWGTTGSSADDEALSTAYSGDPIDDVSLEVNEGDVSLSSPSDTYVSGSEVDVNGSATSGVDEVAIFARDNDEWEAVDLDNNNENRIDVDGDDTFEQEDVALSAGDYGGNNILSFEGTYRIGVIDASDLPSDFDPEEDTLSTSEFNGGTSSSDSLRVVGSSLQGSAQTVNGQVSTDDARVDINGTAAGESSVTYVFVGPRGDIVYGDTSVDDDDTFSEEDVSLSSLSQGTVTAHMLVDGRDNAWGDGEGDDLEALLERLDSQSSRSGDQIRSSIVSNTIDDTASDDLMAEDSFQLTDGLTSISSVYAEGAEASGVNAVAAGETMVVEGETNMRPDDNTITVEVLDEGGDSITLDSTDEWNTASGTWTVSLDTSDLEAGSTYTIEADDGENSDRVDVEIVEERVTPEPDTDTPEPDTDTPEPDTDTPEPDTDTPEPDTETATEEPTSTSTPGFGVVVALTALLAAALLAVRRD